MNIISGIGTPYGVSLSSENFTASASITKSGDIKGGFSKRVKTEDFFLWKYLPLTLRLFIDIFSSFKLKQLLVFFGIMSGLVILLLVISNFTGGGIQGEGVENSKKSSYILIGLMVVLLGYSLYTARGFHAAEHMAISAYENHGVEGLDKIETQTRLHEYCGGRFLFPIIIAFICSSILVLTFGANLVTVFSRFIFLEIVLWIDKLVGYNKIGLTHSVSMWLQRVVTTRPPDSLEVEVGQEALRQLLIAEGEIEESHG